MTLCHILPERRGWVDMINRRWSQKEDGCFCRNSSSLFVFCRSQTVWSSILSISNSGLTVFRTYGESSLAWPLVVGHLVLWFWKGCLLRNRWVGHYIPLDKLTVFFFLLWLQYTNPVSGSHFFKIYGHFSLKPQRVKFMADAFGAHIESNELI